MQVTWINRSGSGFQSVQEIEEGGTIRSLANKVGIDPTQFTFSIMRGSEIVAGSQDTLLVNLDVVSAVPSQAKGA